MSKRSSKSSSDTPVVFTPSNVVPLHAGKMPASKAAPAATGNRETTVTFATDCDPESFDDLPLSTRMKMRAQLRKCLHVIQQSRKTWQTESAAWMEIRDHRLYLAEGFTDFGQFCLKHLQAGKSTVNRQIAVGEVNALLASTGASVPTSERQIRPLLSLRQPKQDAAIWGKKVTEVWAKVVHDAEITKKPITEQSVLIARKQLGFDPQPTSKPREADHEKRWQHLKAALEDQWEFCPHEHRRELRERIIRFVNGLECGMKHSPDSDASTALQQIGLATEQDQVGGSQPELNSVQTDQQVGELRSVALTQSEREQAVAGSEVATDLQSL